MSRRQVLRPLQKTLPPSAAADGLATTDFRTGAEAVVGRVTRHGEFRRGLVLSFQGHRPKVASSVFVAKGAWIIGRVAIGQGSNVWFNAVLRGDIEPIEIGEFTNIQDGAVLHTDEDLPLKIGNYVTVGHQAIVHGCTIGDETLVGMGAIVMNGVRIGRQCLIGAGALLTEKFSAPDGSLIYGAPARIVSQLSEHERSRLKYSAELYYQLAQKYRGAMRP